MDNYQNYYDSPDDSSPGMASAALVLGICSVALFWIGISFITGALGILLALLSRGIVSMKSNARIGLTLSAIGLAIEIAIFSFGIYLFRSGAMDPYIDQFQDLYEEYFDDSGISLEDLGIFSTGGEA